MYALSHDRLDLEGLTNVAVAGAGGSRGYACSVADGADPPRSLQEFAGCDRPISPEGVGVLDAPALVKFVRGSGTSP